MNADVGGGVSQGFNVHPSGVSGVCEPQACIVFPAVYFMFTILTINALELFSDIYICLIIHVVTVLKRVAHDQ